MKLKNKTCFGYQVCNMQADLGGTADMKFWFLDVVVPS